MRTASSIALGIALACASFTDARAQADSAGPRLVGYLQARETYSGAALAAALNRARVGVTGLVGHGFSYRVTVELGQTTPYAPALRDALIRWTNGPLGITAGQFKTPFSLAFLMSAADYETADKPAAVTTLPPKWDLGVMGDYRWRRLVVASLGVFNGEGMNVGVNRDSNVMVVARLAGRPLPSLTLGADVARSRDSTRYGFEAGVERGPVVVKGEILGETRRAGGQDDQGWFVLAAWRPSRTLQLVAQQEDFRRPAIATFVRNTATTLGANLFLAEGRVRLLGNYVSRRIGTRTGAFIAQVQVRFGRDQGTYGVPLR